MESEFVILGGGVAGLCAAVRLVELGKKPTVIDAGEIPTHKVCGEFFSPESMPQLKKWDIHPLEIHEAHFHTDSHTLKYRFPTPAGSLSHISFDPQIAARASNATILTSTKVTKLSRHDSNHILELSTGQQIHTPNLIIATGRLPEASQQKTPAYIGIKAHFEGDLRQDLLEKFFFDGAYVGVSPIEEGKFNVACLTKYNKYQEYRTPEAFIEHLCSQSARFNTLLKGARNLFDTWMLVSAPEFGIRETPQWPNTYFIGDAAGSIPPVTGNGLTLAIKSGIMAAEYAIQCDYKGFQEAWKKRVKNPILWGKTLNSAAMTPWTTHALALVGGHFPSLLDFFYKKTRGSL